MLKKIQDLLGERILKTGLSVFITAWICQLLGWPAIFAVMAAIVTIEPSVKSSIKKGMIRLPAAVLGAAVAMLFDFMFGQVPLTYALSALLTIYICYRLRWDEAIVVATLTALAMIEITANHFLAAFFTRIGTTSTGIIVSTLVNFLVWPPDFTKAINQSYNQLFQETKELLHDSLQYQLNQTGQRQLLQLRFAHLLQGFERTTNMIRYQREEYQYRRRHMHDMKKLNRLQEQIDMIQNISSHVGDILNINTSRPKISDQDRQILLAAWKRIECLFSAKNATVVQNSNGSDVTDELYRILHRQPDTHEKNGVLTPAASLSFELLTIHAILQELIQLGKERTEQQEESDRSSSHVQTGQQDP